MKGITEIPNSIVVYSDDVTPGDAAISPQELSGLKGKTRPNGLYRYVYGILFTCAVTATPGQGAADMDCHKLWQLLKRVYLQLGGLDEPLVKSLSSLDIAAFMKKIFRLYSPDMLSDYLPVTAVDDAGGAAAHTVKYFIPLAPRFLDRESPYRFTGLVPLSAFVSADMQITPCTSATIDTLWTIGDITLEVRLCCVDLNVALPFVPVFFGAENKSGSLPEVMKGPGDTRYLGGMVAAQTDADFTLPDAYTMTLDKKPIHAGVDPDRVIEELDFFRDAEFNDGVGPDALPLFTPDNRELDAMPLCTDSLVLEDVAQNNSNACRILVAYSEELSDTAQVGIQTDHGVDKAVAIAAVRAMLDKKTKATRALVTDTLVAAAG
jgi:hypothetical protein